ncbi:MAG: hypothetical protein Ct9H300mP26_1300 [Acidimicrobiales bacterium]|nr:MAG: hypothetical protein Ct9H300mP26_1300 [Acidimicrobiales bacterium]
MPEIISLPPGEVSGQTAADSMRGGQHVCNYHAVPIREIG